MSFDDNDALASAERQLDGSAQPDTMKSLQQCSHPGREYAVAAALVVSAGIVAAGFAVAAGTGTVKAPAITAEDLATMLQNFDKVELQKYSWGWIRWLMNSKLDPKSEMTFGIVQLNAGQSNPQHMHPNCEELLYVLSGTCEHQLGDQTMVLKEGDVLRIPKGVPHAARTFAASPMRAVIAYSSGDRQFVLVK